MFNKMKTSTKLMALVLIPLIGIVFFSLRDLAAKSSFKQELRSTQAMSSLVVTASSLVHELQKERGLSAGFLASQGVRFKDDLAGQRQKTDAAAKKLKSFVEQNIGLLKSAKSELESASAGIDKLAATRSSIDALQLEGPASFKYYTKTISDYFNITNLLIKQCADPGLTSQLIAYQAFLNAKEFAGQERATLNAAFTADKFTAELYQRFLTIMASQEQELKRFTAYAGQASIKEYQHGLTSAAFVKTAEMRKTAIDKAETGGFGIAPADWFKTITEKINGMKQLEDSLARQIESDAAKSYATAQQALILSVIVATAVGSGSLLLLVLIIRSISATLGSLKGEATRLAESAKQGQLSVRGDLAVVPDEFQGIIQGFNDTLDAVITPLNVAADYVDRIAKGDVPPLITSQYHGDFNALKNNLNTCINAVNALIRDANTLSQAAVAGQLTTRADASNHQGDFRKIIEGVNATLDAVIEPIAEIQQILGYMADGNLNRRMEGYVKGDFQAVKDSLNHALSQLSDAIGKVTVNARQVAAATGQTSSAIGQISDGSQTQMQAIGQVANAVKETAASIVDVSRNTEEASNKARQSVQIVQSGQLRMQQMVEVVNNIAANSEKINKITDVIEKIANKTNLLSLNAAIEAARAGEHGRGFAVVAEEVGKLAASAAESTQEIMMLVEQAVRDANSAVATVREVSLEMKQISDGSLETDAMLQRISAALEQQSAAVQQVNSNVAGLSKVAESNATAAEEITATVFELARIADNTRQEAERFRV